MARRNTQGLVTLQLPVVVLRVRAHLLSRSEDAVKRFFVPTVFGQVPRLGEVPPNNCLLVTYHHVSAEGSVTKEISYTVGRDPN